jgi:hypothetical protein
MHNVYSDVKRVYRKDIFNSLFFACLCMQEIEDDFK